jgi:indolepyruvate ferredoxin oxidoreductase alpha subunit
MTNILNGAAGSRHLLMGNEAIARGALEAGVGVIAGYPGTPSSEIVETLAKVSSQQNLYVEWSVNEKVAMEVAAAGSFAGLRSMAVMKQNGVNVGSDFLLHLALTGTRGGMVLVHCDDPGALSSANEGESRHFARMLEIPLLEPGDFQEAKDMITWAFELSEKIHNVVMVRSVTRLSHASGNVVFGELPAKEKKAFFKHDGGLLDPLEGPMSSLPAPLRHVQQQQKLAAAVAEFEASAFNTYRGPDTPELLVITSSACHLYCKEAISLLGLEQRVGLLKLGTTWPLPPDLMQNYLRLTDRILIVEEVISFLEENVKIIAAELAATIGPKIFFGKRDGTIPGTNEMNPDLVVDALAKIMEIEHEATPPAYAERSQELVVSGAPGRDMTFCAGCPHRASFWTLHNVLQLDGRQGFVCGDIGCYSLAVLPTGFSTLKTLHAMGSGVGLASGFGKLGQFGMNQPILATVGDSTFFHAVLPALINAAHHQADITVVVLDNSGTAMTGFQSHPGRPVDAAGNDAPAIDVAAVCQAMGSIVRTTDPFDIDRTQQTLLELFEIKGLKVLVLKQACALSPQKKGKKMFDVTVDENICLGQNCGCNQLCTRIFKCPGLKWNAEQQVSGIDEVICVGCGVCASICPAGAIQRKEVA